MEYIYAVRLLLAANAEISEANLTAILSSAGVESKRNRVRALVAALEDVDLANIDDELERESAVEDDRPGHREA